MVGQIGRILILVQLDDGDHPGVPTEAMVAGVQAACRHLGVEVGEVSLALLDDEAMARLNAHHLGHEGPTDVISFALYSEGEPVVGDIYLGYSQAARQAHEEGVTLEEELVRLAIHGTLHVLGLDHPDAAADRPGSEMYLLQEVLVAQTISALDR